MAPLEPTRRGKLGSKVQGVGGPAQRSKARQHSDQGLKAELNWTELN